jgi:hypothetical protein
MFTRNLAVRLTADATLPADVYTRIPFDEVVEDVDSLWNGTDHAADSEVLDGGSARALLSIQCGGSFKVKLCGVEHGPFTGRQIVKQDFTLGGTIDAQVMPLGDAATVVSNDNDSNQVTFLAVIGW